MAIAIIVPVLNRPHRVVPLIENIAQNTLVPYRLLFVASPRDDAELDQLQLSGANYVIPDIPPGPGNYARKINFGYHATTEPYIFTGADDLHFHRGWDTQALAKFTDGIGVVGTNDLGNPKVLRGELSTHSLVARWYADLGTIDQPSAIYCPLYYHEFVDNELVETAQYRGAWAMAPNSHVEHLHPHWDKAPADDLYNAAPRRLQIGRRLYRQRQSLWQAQDVKKIAPITVVIGTYGDDSWRERAEKAALSVEQQTDFKVETILVHGKSLADARNEGAARATSPFLCFLDADDELHPHYLREMCRIIRIRHANILLYPAVQFILPEGPKPVKMFRAKDLRLGNYLVIGTIVNKGLFHKAGGFDSRWEAYEDWALWMRVHALGARILPAQRAIYIAHWASEGRNNTIADKSGLKERILADFDKWQEQR